MMSSKFLSRSANALKNGVARRQQTLAPRTLSTTTGVSGRASALPIWAVTGATATFLAVSFATNNKSSNVTKLERRSSKGLPVVMFGEPQEEADTGIMFPPMVNGFTLMGCGVRIKYVFVKVYAVGAYLRPEDFKGMKDDAAIEKKLLDPSCHKTIRIVMVSR